LRRNATSTRWTNGLPKAPMSFTTGSVVIFASVPVDDRSALDREIFSSNCFKCFIGTAPRHVHASNKYFSRCYKQESIDQMEGTKLLGNYTTHRGLEISMMSRTNN
jgi:hypothetical protein